MKTIIWVILLQLRIYDVTCNEDILSKFHQNGFKVRDVRMELMNYSKKHFHFAEFKTFQYNRTTPAINFTIRPKINMKDKTEVVVQVQKFLSNEYRHFPIRFQINLQKGFQANILGLQGVKDCGNITSFYFEKDITYHGCNFVLDDARLPPLIPNGRFRVDHKMMYQDEETLFVSGFGEIYTPIAYPKK